MINPDATFDPPSAFLDPRSSILARLLGTLSGKNSLALLDQAVVSGTNFLTTVLIGRWCGAGDLGAYSLGFSLLVTWVCVQESLIALPYIMCWRRTLQQTQADYAGGVLIQQWLLSGLAVVALATTAAVLSLTGAVPDLTAVVWTLAAITPFALLREFGRRYAFAHLRMAQALVLDLAVAAVQIAGLFWLASTGALAAATAYLAVGAACAVAGVVWLYLARTRFTFRRGQLVPSLRKSWSLGKWLFASQVTVSVQWYFIHWLLAATLGVEATGVYAACLTAVQFSNPLILGLSNALAPQTAQAFARGGAELWGVVLQSTFLLGTAMALFCAGVLFWGDDVIGLLYRGSQYGGHDHTIVVLALAMLAAALGMPSSHGLAAVGRPDWIFKSGLMAVGLSLVLVPVLVVAWGVPGAAYGFLAGNIAGSVGRCLAFSALVDRRGRVWEDRGSRREFTAEGAEGAEEEREEGKAGKVALSSSAPSAPSAVNSLLDPQSSQTFCAPPDATVAGVVAVLQQFSNSGRAGDWLIEQLDEGAQASIFAVHRRDGRPLSATNSALVVKLYKPTARQGVEVVRGQYESLFRFHALLNDTTSQGWKIYAPAPVYQCDRPPALVMTRVPGRSLSSCLETGGQAMTEVLGSIAEAVVAAMERCWSVHAGGHGDLNFDNILCDVAGRNLSFVDTGVLNQAFGCEGVSRRWYPASRDLAYLLYDTTVAVRKTLGNSGARRRQQDLAERVLQVFLERTAVAEQHGLLEEIQAWVQVHLNQMPVSRSPRGIWHLLLKRITARRIAAILAKLKAAVGAAGGGLSCYQKGRVPQ
jgi:O-antigen/teichoic acid export membrane protein